MNFNINKTKIMTIGRIIRPIIYNYSLNSNLLEHVTEFNDLGIIITNNFNWQKHIDLCCNKANKRLGFIQRKIGYGCSPKVKLLCYTSLVRPILEYGSIIWSNYNRNLIQQVEAVQRKAGKFILNDYEATYASRLLTCQILPLTLRREYLDASFFYNCINDQVDINIFKYVQEYDNNAVTRLSDENVIRLKSQRVKKTYCLNFYNHRIVNIWNHIPHDIIGIEPSPSGKNTVFKKCLKRWLMNKVPELNTDCVCTWVIHCTCPRCRVA